MIFKIKNFGKIAEASIILDGITVICGNNNTGKSTIGKALFSFYNALYDYKSRIADRKYIELMDFISINLNSPIKHFSRFNDDNSMSFITSHEGKYSVEELKDYIELHFSLKVTKEKLAPLVNNLNASEIDILNEYVFRYFNNIMNNQIKRVNSANGRCTVTAEFKGSKNNLKFTSQKCDCNMEEPIAHKAYYINSPFSLDYLNRRGVAKFGMTQLDKNVVDAILQAQADITEDSMANILDSVINKKDLEDVRNVLKQAYTGNTRIDQGMYFYIEDGVSFDFRNISAGLKSFALIERLLETGVLKRKDVLILDEPEIHLHSEWQIIYAELIVVLQKKFDLTILLVTHSFQFLESLTFFMKKYGISNRGNYYIPESTDKGIVMKNNTNNLTKMKKNLKSGMYTLANMQLKELNDGDSDEEDN